MWRRPETRSRRLSFSQAAGALFGPEHLVLGGVVDHGADDLALVFQRDRDRPVRQAVQEVGGAVQRIDDPAPGRVLAPVLAGFLAQPAIGRAAAQQIFLDHPLGLAVGLGHEIARTLGRDLQVLDLAEVLDQAAAARRAALIIRFRLALPCIGRLLGLAPASSGKPGGRKSPPPT
jgi:hypothetical protein